MRMHKLLGFTLLISALLLSGCGRKEAPQPVTDSATKPSLSELSHEVVGNILQLKFTTHGSSEGVGYQIDRTEMDPYCQCPGFWRRYDQIDPHPKRVNFKNSKMIKLNSAEIDYLFRVRAFDTAGNLGPWSKSITARGVDLYNK